MPRLILLMLCSLLSPDGTALGPFTDTSSFSADLLGPVDTRAATWGNADAVTWRVVFSPPAGFAVRILHVRGDLIAWPRVLPGETPVGQGSYAGVLIGLQTTGPEGSIRCTPCADNTMLYLQGAMRGEPVRLPFDVDVSTGGLLGRDNTLVVKVASWLNTTGYPIHLEPTFTMKYRYERTAQ